MGTNHVTLLCILVFTLTIPAFSQVACTSSEINPVTSKALVPNHIDSAGRGMADNYYLWENGTTLKIKFLSGSKSMQNNVRSAAEEWLKYANIKYQWVTSGPANIRILLGKGKGHNSYIGTVCNLITDDAKETMNLDTTDFRTLISLRGTVMHEFGHALGLLHEHSSPISGINWNKDTIYKNYYKWYGWDKQKVDYQVFRRFSSFYTNGSVYDNKSIMHYSIEPWETNDGYAVPWNYHMSQGDKELIAALYPKKGSRKNDVTRVSISNFQKMEIKDNKQKQGLSIYPSFDMAASGKPGYVFVLAEFFDEYGYAIEDADGEYSMNERVITFNTIKTLPGKKTSYNKLKKDFELFIPYEQLELPYDENSIQVRFRVLIQTDDNEIKDVYYGKPASFQFSKKSKSTK